MSPKADHIPVMPVAARQNPGEDQTMDLQGLITGNPGSLRLTRKLV